MLSRIGQQDVLGRHGGAHSHRDRLLPERRCVGAEPAGPLQGDRLRIKRARQNHRPVQLDNRLAVLGELWQRLGRLPVWFEHLREFDVERCDGVSH